MRWVGVVVGVTISLLVPLRGGEEDVRAAPVPHYTAAPLLFESNRGQGPRDAVFVARGAAAWSFGREGFALTDGRDSIRVRFGGSQATRVHGEQPLPGRVHYLAGEKRAKGVRVFRALRYESLYPGIDVVLHAARGVAEYDFHVAPGSDPDDIRIVLEDGATLAVDAGGSLAARAGGLVLRQDRPVAYQERHGRRIPVAARYEVDGSVATIALGPYDRSRPLVVDPVISFSTFLGGDGADWVRDVATDHRGNVYVAGYTQGPGFPTTRGAFQREFKPDHDVFVTKFKPSGRMAYSTLLGGTRNALDAGGDEWASGIDVDRQGHAFVTGTTTSDDYPTKDAYQPRHDNHGRGSRALDAFVTKLSRDGSSLVYSTFLGGSQDEGGTAIAVTDDGGAWIGGYTLSPDFPTVGAFQADYGGRARPDGFVTRLAPSGRSLDHSTYLGGTGEDSIAGLAVHGKQVYVTGSTYTNGDDEGVRPFPTTRGSFRADASRNEWDAFVTKFAKDPSRLAYSTFLGGRGPEGHGYQHADGSGGIAVDAKGRAVVAGATDSDRFPLKRAWQRVHHDGRGSLQEAFVTKLNRAGTGLVYSTYFGAGGHDRAGDVAVDGRGRAHVVGQTSARTLVQKWSLQPLLHDYYDGFAATFNRKGRLTFSTYLGGVKPPDGAAEDEGLTTVATTGGSIYVAGYTEGSYPLVRPQQKKRFGKDGVVTRLRPLGNSPLHRARVTLRLREGKEFLWVSGRVAVPDGFTPCSRRARVVVETEGSDGRWHGLGGFPTDRRGRYRVRTWDSPGRYRAEVSSFVTRAGGRWHRCVAVHSAVRRHRH